MTIEDEVLRDERRGCIETRDFEGISKIKRVQEGES
jgi:hypothetical protein